MDREEIERQRVIDIQIAFGSDSGKRALELLSAFCSENENTYVRGDTHGSAFQEGARSVILYIRDLLNRNPDEKKQVVVQNKE